MLIHSKLREKNHEMQFNINYTPVKIFPLNFLHCLALIDVISANQHAQWNVWMNIINGERFVELVQTSERHLNATPSGFPWNVIKRPRFSFRAGIHALLFSWPVSMVKFRPNRIQLPIKNRSWFTRSLLAEVSHDEANWKKFTRTNLSWNSRRDKITVGIATNIALKISCINGA